MADDSEGVSSLGARFERLLDSLVRMASGDLDHRIALSDGHDEVDAVAHAINVLVGELQIVADGLRRAKEQAEAANVAKTTFLRNVSHEIRTPLTVVLGTADLIASGKLPADRVRDHQSRISSNARALVGILDDLIDLAKVEAEKLEYDSRPVLLGETVGEVVSSLESQAEQRNISLIVESDERASVAIADPKRLRQILINLLGNALKFTLRGEVSVRFGYLDEGEEVAVDVSDTGIGLTEGQRRLLFEPFAQADPSIAGRFGGSGLGLALSKRFAEGMGGSLRVLDSQPGAGTTFRLTLPAVRERDVVPVSRRELGRPEADLRGHRLLVVDDHEEVRSVTAALLRLAGATVVEAADGQEAIDRAHEMSFDAVLMDVRMPRVDGLEATRRLRRDGVLVPIVAMTADAMSEQEAECLEAGCTAYLSKPINFNRLIDLLEASAPLDS